MRNLLAKLYVCIDDRLESLKIKNRFHNSWKELFHSYLINWNFAKKTDDRPENRKLQLKLRFVFDPRELESFIYLFIY